MIGGLGVFMLGLGSISTGIQATAVNRVRAALARVAGTPIKGLPAGTLITGAIQSSTATTVTVVGSVNAGASRTDGLERLTLGVRHAPRRSPSVHLADGRDSAGQGGLRGSQNGETDCS